MQNESESAMNVLRNKKAVAVFILPALLFYILIVFFPIFQSLLYSFYSWDGITNKEFLGITNYINLFKDRVFLQAFVNNLGYAVIVILMQVFIGLVVAILLTYVTRGREVIRTLYFTPAVIATVAVTQLFRNIYSFEPIGIINIVLKFIGLENLTTAWLSNPKTALIVVSVTEGWRFIGLYMIIFYIALISLHKDVLDAARIDGASEIKLLWYVKLPLIKPIIGMSLILCVIGVLRGFDIPYLLTGGGPGNLTELVSTYMYKKAFSSMQYGYGSAIAVFIIIESLIAVALVRGFFQKH